MGKPGKVKFILYVEFPLCRYVAQHFFMYIVQDLSLD